MPNSFLIKNFFHALPFYEKAAHFSYRISMDTKRPIAPSSHGNSYVLVIVDALSHFVVTNPALHISPKDAIQALLFHWITNFVPPQYLVTDRGTEYINQDMTQICSLFVILTILHLLRTHPLDKWFNRSPKLKSWNSPLFI